MSDVEEPLIGNGNNSDILDWGVLRDEMGRPTVSITIINVLGGICNPYILVNLLIAVALFFMYTAIAFSNNSYNPYIFFLLLLVLYILIIYILFFNGVINFGTLLVSLIVYMVSYNYLPLAIVKNPSPNNYILLINLLFIIASFFNYYTGYKKYLEATHKEGSPFIKLLGIIFLSVIGGFLADSIVFGCVGVAYLPNYVINSNVDVCSRPSKQTFKCSSYKNGKLVS